MRSAFVGSALLAVAACGATAVADFSSVNSVVINERVFNDYPDSTLATVNNYPNVVSFTDSNFGNGGFANRHDAVFSADGGATPYLLQTSDGFDISVDVMMDAGSLSPRKEVGIRFNFNGFDGLFILASDNGESAAFGGVLPFHTFGNGAYTPGTVANMRVIYRPDDDADPGDGDASTIEYILNGNSSGELEMTNLENGFIPDTQIALYGQFVPDGNNPGDFGLVEYRNIVALPEPGSMTLLALVGLVGLGQRRARS